MYTPLNMLIDVFERAALLLLCLFLLTRIPRFKLILQNESYSPSETVVLTIIFCAFAIFETYSGIKVEGAFVNVRIIAIMSGGILFGPWVGIITGIVSGIHRYAIDIHGVTSVPCLITSIIAGILSGYINHKVKKPRRWIYGIAGGMFCEILTMLLILAFAHPFKLGLDIVSKIGFPMIVGEVNVGLIVLLVMMVESEKEMIAAKQAKLALEIANKTLPYFRSINSESLKKICTIIKEDIQADAVAITDKQYVLAYVGYGEEKYKTGQEIISDLTKSAIKSGNITIKNRVADQHIPEIEYLLIMPFKEQEEVTGALKVYYREADHVTFPLQTMAIGLSQIISTLMEISRVEQMKEAANKAELKALQTTINPHFLFNALNAIASTTRRNPERARELIVNLSSYMRYNLELNDELIDIFKELQQVRDYIEIEKARFGSRIQVEYDIDEVNIAIPSLLIQPLVENAIIHGILKAKGPGMVCIAVKDLGEKVRIYVKDTGAGIEEEVVKNLYSGRAPAKNIGLYNVHQRVTLFYGKGLVIRNLSPGTEVYFDIPKEKK
jgi:two-component system LytT family sensor kinase